MKVFSLAPDGHADGLFRKLLKKIEASGESAVISLQPGRYLFRKEEAAFCDQPVSNTVVYDGNIPRKHVGLLLAGMSDLTIEGNGAELLFDGDMSAIALLNCRNIVLRNFSVDYLHPRVVEMRCTGCRGREADFELHPDSRRRRKNGSCNARPPTGRAISVPRSIHTRKRRNVSS